MNTAWWSVREREEKRLENRDWEVVGLWSTMDWGDKKEKRKEIMCFV